MITSRTVIVLGAGANVPYGFSTGGKLLDSVRGVDVRALMGNAGQQVTAAQCREFERALADNMLPSIDALLEHRRDLWQVGKRVIATLLYSEESQAKPPSLSDDWMSYVFERMAEGATTLESFGQNPVEFVTFNYDRYLEYRFIRGLVARYRVAEEAAWAAIQRMKFLHLHGSLGYLPEQGSLHAGSHPIALGAPNEPNLYTLGIALPQVEQTVRIVHEADQTPAIFADAQASFARAQQILFLGFGFGRANVERLGTVGISGSVSVYCTAYGMTESEISHTIGPSFPNHPNVPARWMVENAPIRQFLRDRVQVLR
jgi:hypothetical protein